MCPSKWHRAAVEARRHSHYMTCSSSCSWRPVVAQTQMLRLLRIHFGWEKEELAYSHLPQSQVVLCQCALSEPRAGLLFDLYISKWSCVRFVCLWSVIILLLLRLVFASAVAVSARVSHQSLLQQQQQQKQQLNVYRMEKVNSLKKQ